MKINIYNSEMNQKSIFSGNLNRMIILQSKMIFFIRDMSDSLVISDFSY